MASSSPPARPTPAHRPTVAVGALLGLALLAGCKGSPRAAERGPVADPERRGPPVAPVVTAPSTPVVPPAGGLPPGPPPGTTTSDRGSRLARPTPLGQLAPEDAPALPAGR